jgi:hypothetical protein
MVHASSRDTLPLSRAESTSSPRQHSLDPTKINQPSTASRNQTSRQSPVTRTQIYGDPHNASLRRLPTNIGASVQSNQLAPGQFDHDPVQSSIVNSEECIGEALTGYPKKVSYVSFSGDPRLLARVDTSTGNLLAIYQGELQEGLPHGQGVLKYSIDDFYEGRWELGLAHGFGKLSSAGYKYQGSFAEGLFEGQGILTVPHQGVYEGQFVAGRFHGKGKFTWQNNMQIYIGSWKNGYMNGTGILVWPDGRKFYGEFVRGLKHGSGTGVYSCGRKCKGIWNKGNLKSVISSEKD